jgi:hypothetical protein
MYVTFKTHASYLYKYIPESQNLKLERKTYLNAY